MNKIFLVDGMSLVFRAYHALAQANFRSPDGMPTGAIYGFVNIVTNFLEKENPEYIAVAFDTSAPTFRHEKYDFYKANRAEFPKDLQPQLPIIKKILDLIGVPRIEFPGYEADDIIGTIAKKNANSENHFFLVTSDKDFYQLIDENISVFKPSSFKNEDFEIVSYSGVYDKFGVSPQQVIDVLALTGDSVDNIPGIKGIGEKTAIPLIQQWGTLDKLYENLDSIQKESLRNKLIEGKEFAYISKELATIDTNVDLNFDIELLKRKPTNFNELDALFKQLGFTKIRQRWLSKNINILSQLNENNEETKEIDYNVKLINVNTLIKREYRDLLDKIIKTQKIYFIYSINNNIINNLYCLFENSVYKVEIYNNYSNIPEVLDLFTSQIHEKSTISEYFLDFANQILQNKQVLKISYDIKSQLKYLNTFGLGIELPYFDIMIASYVINPDNNHSLLGIVGKYEKDIYEKLERKDETKSEEFYKNILIAIQNIFDKQQQELILHSQVDLIEKIEFPLIRVLNEMELNGVKIDLKSLKEISLELDKSISNLKTIIYHQAGEEFNIESPKQLASILFDKLRLPIVKKTKTGASTDISVLEELIDKHPIIEKIIEFRQLVKLKNTYVDALPKLINPTTGKIHTTYQQTIASTGRLTSTDPNLQNIPIRSDQGREIRKAFVSSFENGKIMSADYSQIELRVMAYYSKDENLIEAFKKNIDIHSATASKLFSIPIDKVDSNYRRIAKTVNFGIMYGLGAFGLAQRLKIPRPQAQKIISNYFEKYPKIKEYIDSTIKKAEKEGFTETILHRRRYFTDINNNNRNIKAAAERAAINFPIQGSAADMIKLAMVAISNDFAKYQFKSKLILQVHDEIVVDLYPTEEPSIREVLISRMENAIKLDEVPIVVEVGVGNNWLEAH